MGDVTLPAHFDGERILLDQPFDLKPNSKLFVTVVSATETEREDWLRLSQSRLEDAYGNDEPEYSLDDLKKVNSKYERR
jgi:hypothetical protein